MKSDNGTNASNCKQPLSATIESGELVIRIGVSVLAISAAYNEDNFRYDEGIGEEVRDFAITDAPKFAAGVLASMLDEDEDGSSALTDFMDRMCGDAIESGEGCTDAIVIYDDRDSRETF